MPIVNRDLDVTQQKQSFAFQKGPVVTGQTLPVVIAPWPAQITQVEVCALGLSGSPVYNIEIHRLTSGGMTQMTGGMTNLTLQALGTSGPQAGVLAAVGYTLIGGVTITQGSSLLTVGANDVIVLKSSGANTAVNDLAGVLVLQALQDVRTHFGS